MKGDNSQKLADLKQILKDSPTGLKGIEEITAVMDMVAGLELKTPVELDLTLARGLNYYTGAIFEVKALDVVIGSITGGGRYDDLTGIFGLKGVSGVGISFGADRIFDVMNQLNLYPETATVSTQLMFVNFGEMEALYCLKLASILRSNGILCELYPDNAKLKKQMAYADRKGIPFVAVVGEEEMQKGLISLKNMQSGEQTTVTVEQVVAKLKV